MTYPVRTEFHTAGIRTSDIALEMLTGIPQSDVTRICQETKAKGAYKMPSGVFRWNSKKQIIVFTQS